jgi:hypothetical protein
MVQLGFGSTLGVCPQVRGVAEAVGRLISTDAHVGRVWLGSCGDGYAGGGAVMSARDEVLTYGLIDWVELDQIHRYVAQENAGEPLSVIQEKTLDLIRSLVQDGLFEVGDLKDGSRRFEAWDIPLDESMRRIYNVYVTNFADQNTWPWFCWLDLTEKGQPVAEAAVT